MGSFNDIFMQKAGYRKLSADPFEWQGTKPHLYTHMYPQNLVPTDYITPCAKCTGYKLGVTDFFRIEEIC